MKFKTNDILENRNGTRVQITHADRATKEYHYQYINVSEKQFQGSFCHPADEIERYWHLVPGTNPTRVSMYDPSSWSVDEMQSKSRLNRTSENCAHELSEYIGFTERYKFCKKCDYKINS
jgi:hypothetical protein